MLERLPLVPEKRLAVRVTPDALRQVRGGHPWVYADKITSLSGTTEEQAVPGALAVIFDTDRNFAAIALHDTGSPIRLRVLHSGKPQNINAEFWRERLTAAHALRTSLAPNGTTGYRVVNGENDGFGGFIIDRYSDTLVIKIYTAAWFPHLNAILRALDEVEQPRRIVVRLGRLVARLPEAERFGLEDGCVIDGPAIESPILFKENGLTFEADVLDGQKTGHFLDQRDNRKLIGDRSRGADVLDVFSCTGGFSVHAAAGGAKSVLSIDQSPHAIDAAKRNMANNRDRTSGTSQATVVGDAFEELATLGRAGHRYDIVVVDPPSFASKATERDRAVRAYRKLAELALPLVASGGVLFQASCSSRIGETDLVETVAAAARAAGRSIADQVVTGHAIDHPVTFPQGRYLKAVLLTLD